MRKWKIRTKMIAGLAGLVVVIMVLVYSSWSQLMRDRTLTAEIHGLADDIHYAHELNRWAERLSRAHIEIQTIKQDRHAMIKSDRMITLDKEVQNRRIADTVSDIEMGFFQVTRLVDDYKEVVNNNIRQGGNTTLLVDRGTQNESLKEISDCIQDAGLEWANATQMDQEQVAIDLAHKNLYGELERLVGLTHKHFDSIYQGMKRFQGRVRTEQAAKRSTFWFCTVLSGMMIGLLAWQFWTLIVVPFSTLYRGSQLIANGHHHHKILLGTDDEIGSMADTVNDITARFNKAVADVTQAKRRAEQEVRDRTREVIQNEQLASVGFLAAGVAHEINNPLGAIAWSAEALEETLNELPEEQTRRIEADLLSELKTNLELIQSEAFRCKGITKRLLHFSRLSDSTRDSEDIGELVERVVSMVGKVGDYRCKTIVTHIDPDVTAYCNAQEIQQVVLNLVSNALESVDTDGQVDVNVQQETDSLSGQTCAVVRVRDNGCGMDPDVLAHLFEPFFTRRRDKSGTGLGLSISYRIVSLHHGSLTPYSDGEGLGSTMTLRLPAAPPSETTTARPTTAARQTNYELPPASSKWNDVEKVA